jgi:hypothetical protein
MLPINPLSKGTPKALSVCAKWRKLGEAVASIAASFRHPLENLKKEELAHSHAESW